MQAAVAAGLAVVDHGLVELVVRTHRHHKEMLAGQEVEALVQAQAAEGVVHQILVRLGVVL